MGCKFSSFLILEISFLPLKLYDNPHLQNYGSYIDTFLRGFPSYCMGLQVHISTPSRFSSSMSVYELCVFMIYFAFIDTYFMS